LKECLLKGVVLKECLLKGVVLKKERVLKEPSFEGVALEGHECGS